MWKLYETNALHMRKCVQDIWSQYCDLAKAHCKYYNTAPKGLYVKKDYCIGNPSMEFYYNRWFMEKVDYQLRLCNMLIHKNVRKMFIMENVFG